MAGNCGFALQILPKVRAVLRMAPVKMSSIVFVQAQFVQYMIQEILHDY